MGAARSELNIGQLCRERFGAGAALIGFRTHRGTVLAASDWDGPAEIKAVRPSRPDSYEALFHGANIGRYLVDLHLFDLRPGHHEALRDDPRTPRLERYAGVTPSAGIASAPPTEPWPASPSRPGSAVVPDQQSHAGQRLQDAAMAPVAACQAKGLRQLWQTLIQHGAVIAAGPVAQSARQPVSFPHRSDRYRSDYSDARFTRHPSDSGIARDRGCERRDDRRSPGRRIGAARRAATVWPAVNGRVSAPRVRPTWPGGHRSRDRWPFDFERRWVSVPLEHDGIHTLVPAPWEINVHRCNRPSGTGKAKADGNSISQSTLLGTRQELQLWRLPSSPANLANAPERAAETSHIKAHNRTPPGLPS